MATTSQPKLTIEDLVEQARILRAETFSRVLQSTFRGIVPAPLKSNVKSNSGPAQPDLFDQPELMQKDIFFLPLVRGVESIVKTVVVGLRRNAMRRQLLALDDRMLTDIGIRRDDIPSLVASAFSGRDRVPGTQRTAAELYYLVPAQPQASRRGGDRIAA
jgi:uncharacterized protein YjiS (DUF1127 family)